jgi:gamma-glutamylputrescine oxidase
MYMKQNSTYPQDGVFWHLKKPTTQNLRDVIKADVIVIGGGVAGLSAAQSCVGSGLRVVLLEKSFCGGGASGKSSGFVTPYAELGLQFFIKQYGVAKAQQIWNLGNAGVRFIGDNIKNFSIACDFQLQDVLVVANSSGDFKKLEQDHALDEQASMPSSLYTRETMRTILGSDQYYGGIRYPGTFGMNAYDYCQGVKYALQQQGVQVFEETPALAINGDTVTTPYGAVKAGNIIVCVDRFLSDFGGALADQVFPVQTFIAVSEPLSNNDVARLFPQERLMVWDTDLIYTYFRLINGNRLLIGGSDLFSIAWGHEQHNQRRIFNKLATYIKTKFPWLPVTFSYTWPGLIGVSKDVMPVASQDPDNQRVYYITGATGLAWAAGLGNYSAQRIVAGNKMLDDFFAPRKNTFVDGVQKIFGKRIVFSLSNFVNLYLRN